MMLDSVYFFPFFKNGSQIDKVVLWNHLDFGFTLFIFSSCLACEYGRLSGPVVASISAPLSRTVFAPPREERLARAGLDQLYSQDTAFVNRRFSFLGLGNPLKDRFYRYYTSSNSSNVNHWVAGF